MTHLLTEDDCETFRNALLARADEAAGTSAYQPLIDTVELFDKTRSASFRRRAGAPRQATPPAPKQADPAHALASATDDEL